MIRYPIKDDKVYICRESTGLFCCFHIIVWSRFHDGTAAKSENDAVSCSDDFNRLTMLWWSFCQQVYEVKVYTKKDFNSLPETHVTFYLVKIIVA